MAGNCTCEEVDIINDKRAKEISCVQPIYRWYKGIILPSVDHLFMLSELLGVHMEEMLVKKSAEFFAYDITQEDLRATQRRIIAYYKKIYRSVA